MATFFKYQYRNLELAESLGHLKKMWLEEEDIIELVRAEFVPSMRCGYPTAICCDNETPDFRTKLTNA